MAQENAQFYVPQTGPGPSQALLRFVLIETIEDSGVFNISFEQASLDSATYPSQESGLTAGASRISGAGNSASSSSTDAVPTVQPTVANTGTVFLSARGSTTQTYTLPAASTNGLRYTFVCKNISTEILINPSGTDTIALKATVDQGASVVTAAGVGCKNTAATNVLGDLITLVSDGVSQWNMVGQSGIWASQ